MAGNFLDWLRAVQRSNVAAAPPPDTPDLPALADPSSTSIFGIDGANAPVPANLFSADPSPHPDLMAPTSTLSPNGVRTAIAPVPASDPQASMATAPAKTGLFGLHWNQDYSPAQRWQILGATLRDAGLNFSGDGKDADSLNSLLKSVETQNEKLDTRHRLAQLAKAQFPDDPVRQALFAADPTPYISANAEGLKTKLPVVVSEGGQVIDPMTGRLIASNPRAERPVIVPEGATVMDRAPSGTGGVPSSPYAPPSAPTSMAPPPAQPTQPLDPHTFFHDFVMPHEGGLNPHDANGSPTNFGINQAANPDVDVTKLTPAAAADIFASKYFTPSGAASLPPALAAVHADTSFINPKRAQQFLAESDGDPAKYMALRGAWMDNLVQSEPDKYGKYANAWNNRNRDLAAYSAKLGDAPSSPATAPAPPPTPGFLVPVYKAPIRRAGAPTGYRYKADGTTLEPIPGGPGDPTGGIQPIDSNLHGDEYLATVEPGDRNLVKAMVDGRQQPPSSFALTKPYWQQKLQQATQYDPNFDATLWKTRNDTRTAFAKGTQSKELRTINTVTGHIGELYDSIDGLRNFTGKGVMFNGPANLIASYTDPAYQKAHARFAAARLAVASDAETALRPGGGTESGVKSWLKQFDDNASPDAMRAALKELAGGLIAQRVDPLIQQWQGAMGSETDPLVAFYPKAAKALEKVSAGRYQASSPGDGQATAPHAQSSGDIPTATPEQAAALAPGTRFRTTDGRVMVRQ